MGIFQEKNIIGNNLCKINQLKQDRNCGILPQIETLSEGGSPEFWGACYKIPSVCGHKMTICIWVSYTTRKYVIGK